MGCRQPAVWVDARLHGRRFLRNAAVKECDHPRHPSGLEFGQYIFRQAGIGIAGDSSLGTSLDTPYSSLRHRNEAGNGPAGVGNDDFLPSHGRYQ